MTTIQLDRQQRFISTVRSVGDMIAKHAVRHDAEGTFVTEAFDCLAEAGLLSSGVPEELGGGGASIRDLTAMQRELAHFCGSTALASAMHQHVVAFTAWRYRRGLPGAEATLRRVTQDGIVLVSTGGGDFTHPNGEAVKVDGGYEVSGRKIFASQSPVGVVMSTMFAFDDPEQGRRVLNMAVPLASEGVRVLDNWDALGMRGTGSNDVVLDRVFVPDERVLANRPYGVIDPPLQVIITIAMPIITGAYLGVAEAAYDAAVAVAVTKADDPLVQRQVGLMAHRLRIARWGRPRSRRDRRRPGTIGGQCCRRARCQARGGARRDGGGRPGHRRGRRRRLPQGLDHRTLLPRHARRQLPPAHPRAHAAARRSPCARPHGRRVLIGEPHDAATSRSSDGCGLDRPADLDRPLVRCRSGLAGARARDRRVVALADRLPCRAGVASHPRAEQPVGLADGVEGVGVDEDRPRRGCDLIRHPDRVRAVAGLSVPHTPPLPFSLLDIFDQLYADRFFYMLHFQQPSVAEAEFDGDMRAALKKVYFAISGDGPLNSLLPDCPRGVSFLAQLPEPPAGPLSFLTDADLDFCAANFQRTGLTGAFNRYRALGLDVDASADIVGATVGQPSCFIGGAKDAVRAMIPGVDSFADPGSGCTDFRGSTIIPGAGHWVQQEAFAEVNAALVAFLDAL